MGRLPLARRRRFLLAAGAWRWMSGIRRWPWFLGFVGLARGGEVAVRLGRAVADPPAPWGASDAEVAPVAALAALQAARLC